MPISNDQQSSAELINAMQKNTQQAKTSTLKGKIWGGCKWTSQKTWDHCAHPVNLGLGLGAKGLMAPAVDAMLIEGVALTALASLDCVFFMGGVSVFVISFRKNETLKRKVSELTNCVTVQASKVAKKAKEVLEKQYPKADRTYTYKKEGYMLL